jgi:hypothetical protein
MVVSKMIVLYSVVITYSIGKLEHGRNPSFDVISYVWTLRVTPNLHGALPRRSLGLPQCRSLWVNNG